mgnify:CR=1 FL=1|tara:strand:+ start:2474 stop:3652 length:1179 start_codon:yes stop_codon:yes gene_type:complete
MIEQKYQDITIKNSSNSGPKDIFKIRETYAKVFPDEVASFDFHDGKNILYGRLDLNDNIVHANEYYLKQIESSKSENIFCFNFVADAFEDLRNYLKKQTFSKLIPDKFLTTNWDAYNAWSSPHNFYDSRMNDLYQVYVVGSLLPSDSQSPVKNIDDFLKTFFNDFYPNMNKKMPITKSGIVRSKFFNPTNTGLCIEIADDSHSLDSVKLENFIKSPNFDFYLLVAAKFGFLVDKNAPWRLVANLNSPAMIAYMSKYGFNVSNVFENIFVKTYKYDIQNLKVYMQQMYKSFLSISPEYTVEIPTFLNQKCPPYKQPNQKLVERESLTTAAYENNYDDLFWLKIYYRLKLDEMRIVQSDFLLTKELQKIQQIYNSLDFDQTLDYINDRIKSQTS